MKRFILAAFMLGAMVFGSKAQNSLTGSLSITAGGESDVTIDVVNDTEVNSFQFDVVMPSGVNLVVEDGDPIYENGSSTKRGWNYTVQPYDGYVRVIINSTTKTLKNAEAADVITLTLESSKAYSNYDLSFNNVKFAGASGAVGLKYKIGNLGANGYSSFCSIQNVQILEGATANLGQMSGDAISLVEVADNIIAASTGVILTGVEGAAVYATTATSKTETQKNDLIGRTTVMDCSSSTVYVLSTEKGVTGFYKYTGSTIPAGKAYIDGSAVAGARPMIFIGEVTGIDNIAAEACEIEGYDLYGRKANSTKGQMMIENGKKVIRY